MTIRLSKIFAFHAIEIRNVGRGGTVRPSGSGRLSEGLDSGTGRNVYWGMMTPLQPSTLVGPTGRLGDHGRGRLVRLACLAILGLAGTLLEARPAVAMGCHVTDRPALGRSWPGESSGTLRDAGAATVARRTLAVVPRPCSGDPPGVPPGPPAASDLDLGACRPWALVAPESSRLAIREEWLHPRRHPVFIERPPRPLGV